MLTEVVPDSELMSTARARAERLAEGPPRGAIRIATRMMYKKLSMTLDNALEDAAMATLVTNYTDDVQEGIAAFHKNASRGFKESEIAGPAIASSSKNEIPPR